MESAKAKGAAMDAAKELVRELNALRSQVDEVVSHYSLNVKAHIDELIHVLAGAQGAEAKGRRIPPETLGKLAGKARRMKVKPQKGRAKDLKRIQELIDGMGETILDQE